MRKSNSILGCCQKANTLYHFRTLQIIDKYRNPGLLLSHTLPVEQKGEIKMPSKNLVSSIITALLLSMIITACGGIEDSVSSISSDRISQLQQSYADGTLTIDYDSAESFESALNDGTDTTNKIVSFEVKEIAPDSVVGFNVHAGEHLNFKSKDAKEISNNEQVTVLITNAKSKIGSWLIDYELIGTKEIVATEEESSIQTSMETSAATDSEDVSTLSEEISDDNSNRSDIEKADNLIEEDQLNKSSDSQIVDNSESTKETDDSKSKTTEKSSDSSIAVVPSTEQTPTTPSNSNAGNADNFDTYDTPEQQQTDDTYVLNKNTHKFHYPSCKSVKKISPDNYATSSESRDALISQGYEPCGICKP